MPNSTCSVCDGPHYARGLCRKHYDRQRRRGDASAPDRVRFPVNLLRGMAPQADGCIHWTGYIDEDGYGVISIEGRSVLVHRAAYEFFIGPIPEGLQLDHTCHDPAICTPGRSCRHRRCVNGWHLEPVTCRTNLLRGGTFQAANAAKTHCPQGHPYDEANTYINGVGGRECRACNAAYERRRRAARKS